MSFEYPQHVSFECDRCGLCCGDTEYRSRWIVLLEGEAIRISEMNFLGLDEFAEKIEGFEPYVYRMRKTEERKCVFLEDDSCSIYQIRPLICRFYPFELKNPGKNRYVFDYTDECPGIGKGLQLKKAFFEQLFREFKDSMKNNQGEL